VFGWMLDHGMSGAIFGGSAGLLGLGVLSATLVGLRLPRPATGATPATVRG
jgi:hypothetical protein